MPDNCLQIRRLLPFNPKSFWLCWEILHLNICLAVIYRVLVSMQLMLTGRFARLNVYVMTLVGTTETILSMQTEASPDNQWVIVQILDSLGLSPWLIFSPDLISEFNFHKAIAYEIGLWIDIWLIWRATSIILHNRILTWSFSIQFKVIVLYSTKINSKIRFTYLLVFYPGL